MLLADLTEGNLEGPVENRPCWCCVPMRPALGKEGLLRSTIAARTTATRGSLKKGRNEERDEEEEAKE